MALDVRYLPVRLRDMATITRLTFKNMRGVDRQFTRLVNRPGGRLIGRIAVPIYLLSNGRGYKAVVDGRIVGSAFLHHYRFSGYAFNVNVSEEYRRQGVGRGLMRFLEEVALERGRRWMGLLVENDNQVAQAMYEALGYRMHNPYLLARDSSQGIKVNPGSAAEIQALTTGKGLRVHRQYMQSEFSQGDSWASEVLTEFPAGLNGQFWQCRLNGEAVGSARIYRQPRSLQVELLLDQNYWRQAGSADLVAQVIAASSRRDMPVKLRLGSGGHYQTAGPLFQAAGFRSELRPSILMLKKLSRRWEEGDDPGSQPAAVDSE